MQTSSEVVSAAGLSAGQAARTANPATASAGASRNMSRSMPTAATTMKLAPKKCSPRSSRPNGSLSMM